MIAKARHDDESHGVDHPPRGQGVCLDAAHHVKADLRLLASAARRWGIDTAKWESRLDEAYQVAQAAADARTMAECVRTAVAMEAQNQADEHKLTPELHAHLHHAQGTQGIVVMLPPKEDD
jgi:hypothetical protein